MYKRAFLFDFFRTYTSEIGSVIFELESIMEKRYISFHHVNGSGPDCWRAEFSPL